MTGVQTCALPIYASYVQYDAEGSAAANVSQKGVAKADVVVGTLDDTGDIAYSVTLPSIHFHHTDLRVQGGERIGGNLRAGVGDGIEQSALAGAIGTHQTGKAGGDAKADIIQPHHNAVPSAQFNCLYNVAHLVIADATADKSPHRKVPSIDPATPVLPENDAPA